MDTLDKLQGKHTHLNLTKEALSSRVVQPSKKTSIREDENLLKEKFEPERLFQEKYVSTKRITSSKRQIVSGFVIAIMSPKNAKAKKNEVFFIKDNPLIKRKSRSISKQKSDRLNWNDEPHERDRTKTIYLDSRKKDDGGEFVSSTIQNLGFLKKK